MIFCIVYIYFDQLNVIIMSKGQDKKKETKKEPKKTEAEKRAEKKARKENPKY